MFTVLDWLKSLLPPKQFQLLVVVIGIITLGYPVLIKLETVIKNQIEQREENKEIRRLLYGLMREVEFVKGQNSERTRFNNDFAERLIRVEKKAFNINGIDAESR